MAEMLVILVAAILSENFVLSKFMGICPFLGVSKKLSTALGMSVAVTFVMVLSTAVTYPIYTNLLVPNDLSYLQTIVFILVIATLVQFVEIVLRKFIPPLYNALGIYLPLITTNCAVLGVTLLNFTKELTYMQSIINSIGAGLGFLLAMVLFAGVRSKIDESKVPEFLQGLPITLIAAALVSLSFLGFSAIANNLF